ncbi:chitinase [Mycetocola zhadangensis]|uniref:chitinase n=1 Tax=Mycetocola zhadangensis TaxID=1164595 RepID=UPI003A4D89A0
MTAAAKEPTEPKGPKEPRVRPVRRLSALRVSMAIAMVAALAGGGYVGLNWWQSAQATEDYDAWFAGYADVTATPTFNFESTTSDAARDVVLSFIVADETDPCLPTWGTAYDLDEAAETLDLDRRLALQSQRGGQIAISFGGLLNDELATVCKDHDKLVDAYADVVKRYDISTIDLDIEAGNLSDSKSGVRRAKAISELQEKRRDGGDDLAVWLTLPVAPSGITEDGATAVTQMLKAGVDLAGVNVMTMDYGSSRPDGDSQAAASIEALTSAHRQLRGLYARADIDLTDATVWTKLGATPMAGQNDVPAEVFSLADARALNAFAVEKKLGRMSMWSLNRDKTCGSNYVDLKRVSDSCSGIDQGDETFADLLSVGLAGRMNESASHVTASETDKITAIVDDPETSPYPIWSSKASYLKGTKIVWHRSVYEAKWWTRGELPDDPVLNEWETPWTLIGPVLPGEKPIEPTTLPAGTYPDWDGTLVYEQGNRVLFNGIAFESKWWNQGESPAAVSGDPDSSPWTPLTDQEIAEILDAAPATP